MGGGQKRGRTQRRHFRQSRDNVWKHNPKKTRPESESPNPNSKWEPFVSTNTNFEEYYKQQRIVPDEQWEDFLACLRKPLPAAFRINSSGQFFEDIRLQLENDFMISLEAEGSNEYESEAIRPLPWYPNKLAWHLNFSRMQLRKNQTLERFHEFLKHENEVGNITRQEAVSMVPPLFLDVHPDHHVLDMCAAPGSKTFQLLEIIHQSTKPGLLPNGLVIANDVDVQRCNLLIHQTKRMCTANLIVTNHEAQHFPSCSLTKGCSEALKEEGELKKSVLQFDRVLCDVPCSGDGTLRKAPDIWRKWNAGMGNGLHRLQVEIAMRGISLLKVGGRMVYSTCSMNPVENEAVVAEILRRSKGSVGLLDVSSELPELVRRCGVKTWKVRDKGIWLASYKDVPNYRKCVIVPSMFPSDQTLDEDKAVCDGVNEDMMELCSHLEGEDNSSLKMKHQSANSTDQENNTRNLYNSATPDDLREASSKVEEDSTVNASSEDQLGDSKVEVSSFPLERCIRILPHDQNSGAFFIAILHKFSHLQEDCTSRSSNTRHHVPANASEPEDKHQSEETRPLECVSHDQPPIVVDVASEVNFVDQELLAMPTGESSVLDSKDAGSKTDEVEEAEACDNGESSHARGKGTKGKLQTQGKWKGVDPVVLFGDEATINGIRSFYGICESFPLEGYLVTRSSDANHVKRIYYISRSVHDTLQLNIQVGQRLKITSLGLKVFERQTLKDSTSQCGYRLSSEGLPLLLPYISKQIVLSSLVDFRHLLQYRVIKFSDFVDVNFGEQASRLMPGCCVVVLNEGNHAADTTVVDASTIAIICWKGKTNLSIMVSQLDAQELLERLSARFGTECSAVLDENEKDSLQMDAAENQKDEPVANQDTVC